MKKIITIILSICIICVGFSGCGKKSEEIEGKINITIAVKQGGSEAGVLVALKNKFQQSHPDYNIIIKAVISSSYSEAMFKFASSEYTDMVWTAGDIHSPYSSKNVFENLLPYIERDGLNLNDYYDASIKSTHYSDTDNGIWFAPRDYNQLTIFFNSDIMARAKELDSSIKMPNDASYYANGRTGWTWSEFEETLNKLRVVYDNNTTSSDSYNREDQKLGISAVSYPIQAQLGWNTMYYSMIRGMGGDIFDNQKNVIIDSAATKSALQYMYNMYQNKLTNKSGTSLFTKKQSCMMVGVRPELAGLANVGFNYDFAPFPIMDTPVVGAGCSGYAIASTSQKKEECWTFLKWVMSEEGQNTFGSTGAGVPVLKSLETTGDWLNYGDANLNHKAFIANSENNLYLNFADFVKSEDKEETYQLVTDMISFLTYSNYSNYGSLDNLLAYYKTELGKMNK